MAPLLYTVAIIISGYEPILCVLIYAFVPLLYLFPGRIDRHWRGVAHRSRD